MNAEVVSASPLAAPDLIDCLPRHIARLLRVAVEDWCDACRKLSAWEDAFLVGSATEQNLAGHATLLDYLERVGRWLRQSTQQPDFPERGTAELVTMTRQDLADRRAMRHSSLSKESRAGILREVFPGES